MSSLRIEYGSSVKTAYRNRGVSLVELMIALALSAFLLLGLAQVFAASRAAYQTAEGLARVQENGRVGLDLISRDLRMAGHMGCVGSQSRATAPGNNAAPFYSRLSNTRVNPGSAPFLFRFDVPIEGFEFANTGPGGTVNLSGNPAPPAAAGPAAWTPNLPAALAAALFNGVNNPVVGSDIILVRYFSADAAVVTNALSAAASPLTINFASAPDGFFVSGAPAQIAGSGIFAVSDCNQFTVFQPSAMPANAAAGTLTVAWPNGLNQNRWGPDGSTDTGVTDEVYADTGTRIHRGEVVVYYVGTTPRGPSLFRMRFRAAPGAAAIQALGAEELAEGVESLQVVFARDATGRNLPAVSITVPDGFADVEETAAVIAPPGGPAAPVIAQRWRNVARVRFGMLVRSVDFAASATERVNFPVAGTVVRVPADGRMRQVYETSVMQRNQVFGN